MVRVQADESSYLVWASAAEGVTLRRIPAGRWNAAKRCWQFPRQVGVVLALDRVFGR